VIGLMQGATVPKWVASSTMRSGSWLETTTIRDVAEQVAEVKHQPGEDSVVIGSSGLAYQPAAR
jgi:hypothetical protein